MAEKNLYLKSYIWWTVSWNNTWVSDVESEDYKFENLDVG